MGFAGHKDIFFYLCIFLSSLFLFGCESRYDELDLSMYQYRDTKNLVKFVYDASLILKKDGMKGIGHFRKNRDEYITKDYYLYIYDMDGNNIYHAGMKELENTNLIDITDKDGKKPVKLAIESLQNPANPHSWVHYSWWEPGKFYPVPKSSCHFRVKTPEGRELFVGGGLNYPHEEKEFIRIIVDDAASVLKKRGRAALEDISDPRQHYNYRDVRVFVLESDGTVLISPIMGGSVSGKNFLECTDEVGHKPFVNALEKLKTEGSAWEIFMAKNRYKRDLVKKCLYLRKTTMDGEDVYVGAITDLPGPP